MEEVDVTKAYTEALQNLLDHFGYDTQQYWRVLPVSIETDFYWHANKDTLYFGGSPDKISTYSAEVVQGGLRRGQKYSVCPADTNCDGNAFLFVLDNAKEVKEPPED